MDLGSSENILPCELLMMLYRIKVEEGPERRGILDLDAPVDTVRARLLARDGPPRIAQDLALLGGVVHDVGDAVPERVTADLRDRHAD